MGSTGTIFRGALTATPNKNRIAIGGGKGKTLGMSLVAQARLLGSALPTVTGGLHLSIECASVGNATVSVGPVGRNASFVTMIAMTGVDKASSCGSLTLARVVPSN